MKLKHKIPIVPILFAIALVAAFIAACPARADLGDTYAQSCRRFSGEGYVNRQNRSLIWKVNNHLVVEWFVKNRCVCMRMVPSEGGRYQIDDMMNILPYESAQRWLHTGGPSGVYVGNWETIDHTVLASLYTDGSVQVSYRWYISRKGLLEDIPSDDERAPVEDAGI